MPNLADIINTDAFRILLGEELNEAMQKVAEPFIQKQIEAMETVLQIKIKEVEKMMKKKMAECLIAKVEESMTIERFDRDIRLTIRGALKEQEG